MAAGDPVDRLRALARVALGVSAAGSLGLMVWAGRHNRSIGLMVLFTLWVSSPFVALAALELRARRWPPDSRAAFYGVMFAVACGSLVVYLFDALRPRPQAAFFYVVVPPATWVIGGIVIAVAALLSRRRVH